MTKDEAIYFIEKRCESCLAFMNGECLSASECFEVKRMAIEALQDDWIPCSERLPEEDGRYLVTHEGIILGMYHVAIYHWGEPLMPMSQTIKDYVGWYITDDEGDYYADDVIAWKPLPTPYKGGDE